MNEINEIAHEIINIVEKKGAERKEYLKRVVEILMLGGGLREIKEIKLNKAGGANCCF